MSRIIGYTLDIEDHVLISAKPVYEEPSFDEDLFEFEDEDFLNDDDWDLDVWDLDEDEMAKFLADEYRDCPYYQPGDEYLIVRHQM